VVAVNGRSSFPNPLPFLKFQPASIHTGNISSGGADTVILAGKNVSTGSLQVSNDREVRISAGVSAGGLEVNRPGNVTFNGSLIADDIVVNACNGSIFFNGQKGADLLIAAGFSHESLFCAGKGIFINAAPLTDILFNGTPSFRGNVVANANGSELIALGNSQVFVVDGKLSLSSATLVNQAQFFATQGINVVPSANNLRAVAGTGSLQARIPL
jgi:hypothetical protein